MSAYSFGAIQGHGASACALPDTQDQPLLVAGICAHCGEPVCDSDDTIHDNQTGEDFCDSRCFVKEQIKRGIISEGERRYE